VKHSTLAALTVFALAGALAGCSERNPPTGPSVDVATLSPASFIGDRPYAWNFTCHGGVAIASGSINCGGDETFSGTGVRPANSNGFTADVGTNSQTWTFDPAGPFKASLSGSAGGGGHCSLVCIPFHKESGKLTVES